MPTYDFKCTGCKATFEVTRPMGSSDPVNCPSCGGESKRLFSPVGVAFKGSGFHNTDYRPRPKDDAPTTCPSKSDSSPKCAGCPAAE